LDGASCPCPLSAAPRAFQPLTAEPPVRGSRPLDLEDAFSSNRTPDPTPRGAGWRPNPSRSSARPPVNRLATASGSTPARLTFASRASLVTCPFARSKSAVGPPVARWANSRRFSSLVGSARRCKQRAKLAYSRFGLPLAALHLGRDAPSPGRRSTPYPPRLAPWRSFVSRSPEPDELSLTGVSFESLRFGDRAR